MIFTGLCHEHKKDNCIFIAEEQLLSFWKKNYQLKHET